MQRFSKLALAAALATAAATTSARADGPAVNTTPPGSPAAQAAATSAPLNRFAWGGIGFYDLSVGCTGCSEGAFGINAGVALAIAPVAPNFNFDVWGNIAGIFSSGSAFPITVGAGVSYDKLPVDFFGGLGFTVAPGSYSTAVGVDIMMMALYPVPQIAPHLAAQGQLQFDILSDTIFIWSLSVGAAYSF